MKPKADFLQWYIKEHHLEDYVIFRSFTKEAPDLHLVATVNTSKIKDLKIYQSDEQKYLVVKGLTQEDWESL